MDVYYTYHRLLPDLPRPERILRQPKSTSALIFYWGVRRTFSDLDLHNIFFSEDYRREFEALAAGTVADDATIYVNITAKYTPTDAPPGCENWFVMVNVPPDTGQNWEALIDRIRQQVIDRLSRHYETDFGALIACESVLDPRSIELKTSSHQGALYGYSSNNQMAAFLRHPNFSRQLRGLYFCGGSVHPGGGIPLCLLSAKITAEEIGS
jgi:phytoene dehydrogenase-like protein